MTTRTARDVIPILLEHRDVTLNHLAREIRVPQSTLSRFLDGSRPLDAARLRVIAKYFELPADYFPEVREAAVIAAIQSRPRLRDEIYYARLKRPSR
jgi:transcriptional regulator with XRE-family HTH domain